MPTPKQPNIEERAFEEKRIQIEKAFNAESVGRFIPSGNNQIEIRGAIL